MGTFLLRRLLSALWVMLGVSVAVFLFIHMIPGDPVEVMLGESARMADREALRHALGLDLPLWQQLIQYFTHLAQFDLGRSLHSDTPITGMIHERLPATLQLAVAALGIALLLAIPLGIMAAIRQHSAWDSGAMVIALIGVSIPNFVLGPALILLFSISLGWFPVSGRDGLASLVLPALTLGLGMAAILSRMTRAAMLEVLNEDYIRTARAKGLAEHRIILRHALRNAMIPITTLLGLQLGALLGGAVITETIFSWPGLGQLMVDAIQKRDYPVVQACVLLISLCYVSVNTFTDLVQAWLDPRMKVGG